MFHLATYPGLIPGLEVSIILSVLVCIPVGRSLGISVANACLLVFSVGLIVSATLTPSLEALTEGVTGTGRCDFSRLTPSGLRQLPALNEASLNVLLFVPLGVAIGFIPARRHQAAFVAIALVTPVAIEFIQLVAIRLDRACQAGDVADNVAGLVIGLVIGVTLAWLVRRIRSSMSGRGPAVPPG